MLIPTALSINYRDLLCVGVRASAHGHTHTHLASGHQSSRIFLLILEAAVKPVREFESERDRSKENRCDFVQFSFASSLRDCI